MSFAKTQSHSITQEKIDKDQILPKWLREMLIAVSVYNFVLGLIILFLPTFFFSWSGIAAEKTHSWEIAGYLGPILGVGYLLTLYKPDRFWSLGLVGFLSSSVGLFVMTLFLIQGELEFSAFAAMAAFDIMGSIGFAMVLSRVYQYRKEETDNQNLTRVRKAVNFLGKFKANSGKNLEEISNDKPLLLVFLRHFGCTFCREALVDISNRRRELELGGTRIALVHMVDSDLATHRLEHYGLADLPHFSDPEKELYTAFDLKRGTFRQLFGLKSWIEGFRAGILNGNGIGKETGDGFQMPGIFLLHKGRILQSYRHQHAADRPDYVELATCEL